MIHHIKRATRHLIFWSLITCALSLFAVRVLLYVIDDYKIELATEIAKQVNAPVSIGHLKTRIHGLSPQLVLEDIAILSPENTPSIELKELRLGINLMSLMLNRDVLSSSWVTLVGAKLTVKKQMDGSLAIVGLKAGGDGHPLWLLQGRQYQVLQSKLTWQNEQKHGKPLAFDDVNVMIRNKGEQHHINILMNLQEKHGDLLRASFDIQGNIFEPLAITGTGFIEGKNLVLPAWVTVDLPLNTSIKSGVGDFKVWGVWQHSQLVSMTADVQAQQLRISQPHKPDFVSNDFSSILYWTQKDHQWQFDIEHFSLDATNNKRPPSAFSVSGVSADDQQLHNIAFATQTFDLQAISTLAQFFAPLTDEQAKLLAQTQLKGRLENFTLSADLDKQQIAVDGHFANLSVAPVLTFPSIENLSGHIHGNEQHGNLRLVAEYAQLKYPHLFRNPLFINKLDGTLTWQQTTDDWQIASNSLTINSPDILSKSRLQLIIPKADKPVFMDLQAVFSGKNMSKAPTYYPTTIMSSTLVDWLDHAFIGGTVTKGGFLFYGNLTDFPFTKGNGVFEVLFSAEQVELTLTPKWPHLTELAGEVHFFQDSLEVNLSQGKSQKIVLKPTKVSIPSLNKGEMVLVDGEFTASISDTLDFLQKTPLDLPINAVLSAITPKGNIETTLKLTIPMKDTIPAKVDGSAQFTHASLNVKSVDLLISEMTGALKFNQQGIYTNNIDAVTLGYPINIAIKNDVQKTTINATGRTGINELHQQFKMSGWSLATGVGDYKLELQLPYGNRSPELTVQSTLEGISLDLPDKLAKTSEQQRLFSITFDLVDKPLLPIAISYDNTLKAALNFDIKQQIIQAAHVLIGSGNVQAPAKGINLEINSEQLALQNWLGLGFSMAQTDTNLAPTTSPINEIKIHSNTSLWKKTPLGVFDLNLKPNGQQWIGLLNSQFAKGKLTIPFNLTGENRITLNMDELDLSLAKQLNSEDSSDIADLLPEAMPLITLTSQKTRWQKIELGQLNLIAQRIHNGIDFKNITLNSDSQKLTLSGNWQVNGTQSVTNARGRLDMLQADELLKKLDISNDFTKTKGTVDFSVNWQGAPQQFSIANLRGQLDLDLKEGRLLSVEPGFGRILGVLAVAQWIKRLQLDFSDIYEEGLSFNGITGHFDLAQGKVHTTNLIVDAIPAKITLTGDTDLLHHTVDYSIMVAPKSADAVPIAGTIVGKVASLIGRSLTGKDQDGFFFGSQYSVKGEWGNVQVIPHHENDGLLQKTWNGLTDFSWLKQQKD